MWRQKIRKMGTAKNTVKCRIFWWSAGYVGPSWGYVGLSWGQCGPILGLCWPILGLCWPILGLWCPILGAMLAHLEAYVGPCWPTLSHKIQKRRKNGKSTKHRKTRGFLAGGRGRRQGRRPLSPTERRETPTAMPRPGGPWPDLSAYARQPARGPCWGDMGSWEQDLKAMLPHLGAMLVHLGAMLAHLGAMLARLGA